MRSRTGLNFVSRVPIYCSLRIGFDSDVVGARIHNSEQFTVVSNELDVPVPPLAEQRKIAAVLGLVQRAIEQQERLIALTTELKKALLHKLFTEGLRGEPQKQTEIGPVPESWEARSVRRYARVVWLCIDDARLRKGRSEAIRTSNVTNGVL